MQESEGMSAEDLPPRETQVVGSRRRRGTRGSGSPRAAPARKKQRTSSASREASPPKKKQKTFGKQAPQVGGWKGCRGNETGMEGKAGGSARRGNLWGLEAKELVGCGIRLGLFRED